MLILSNQVFGKTLPPHAMPKMYYILFLSRLFGLYYEKGGVFMCKFTLASWKFASIPMFFTISCINFNKFNRCLKSGTKQVFLTYINNQSRQYRIQSIIILQMVLTLKL